MKKIYLKMDWKIFHPKTFEPWTKTPLSGKFVHDSKIFELGMLWYLFQFVVNFIRHRLQPFV